MQVRAFERYIPLNCIHKLSYRHLHISVDCMTKMPLLDLDCLNQISKYTMCTCCGKPAWLFSHMLFDIERKSFLLQ